MEANNQKNKLKNGRLNTMANDEYYEEDEIEDDDWDDDDDECCCDDSDDGHYEDKDKDPLYRFMGIRSQR
jgi:hypothetical protein